MYTRYYIQRNFILAIRCSLHIGTWTVRLFILILSRLRKQSQRMKDAILRDALAVVNFDNIDKLLNNTLMEHRNCHRVQEAYLVIFYYERYISEQNICRFEEDFKKRFVKILDIDVRKSSIVFSFFSLVNVHIYFKFSLVEDSISKKRILKSNISSREIAWRISVKKISDEENLCRFN